MEDPARPWDGARLLRHLRTYYSNLLRRLLEPKPDLLIDMPAHSRCRPTSSSEGFHTGSTLSGLPLGCVRLLAAVLISLRLISNSPTSTVIAPGFAAQQHLI